MKRGTLDHPTAQQLHDAVREVLPDLSLGTVYRNLHQLVSSGDLIEVNIGSSIHYDCRSRRHHHLLCSSCGKLEDVVIGDTLETQLLQEPGLEGQTIDQFDIQFKGICSHCGARIQSQNQQLNHKESSC